MKIRFGLCQCLPGCLDKSSFSEGKGKVCYRFKRFKTSGATGITLLYKTLTFGERFTGTGSVVKVRDCK